MINLQTPTELIEKYPQIEMQFGWTAKCLGVFLKCKLLKGGYSSNLRCSLIDEDSLIDLVQFTNKLLEEQKVKLNYGSTD